MAVSPARLAARLILVCLCLSALPLSPRVVRAGGEEAAGAEVALGSLRGPDGKQIDLAPPPGGLTVLLFYSSECPISNAYSPTLATLQGATAQQPVKWVGVCVDSDLTDADVRAHARDFRLGFPVARDRHGTLARKLGATMVPEAFVIDARNQIRYHGRIDDQFAKRGVRNANPSGNELRDAIRAVLEGKDIPVSHVPVVGCPLPEQPAASAPPTYSNEIARIFQNHCVECHRKGQVGPFPLETFPQAKKRAQDIAEVIEDRLMPPWKASRDVGGPFQHDLSLSANDIRVISAWAEAGAPEGNPADLPPPRTFSEGWTLEGGPDLVVDIGTDFPVPAAGEDIYRCFVVPTSLPTDMYISGIEYRPGNRAVVHHVLAYVDTAGEARKKDGAEPGPGYTCFSGPGVEVHGDLGGWAPGSQPTQLADGIGRALPSKADVVIQVHYHPSGKAEVDRTRIGFRFARKPVRQVMHWNAAANLGMILPAGDSHAEVQASWEVPVDLIAHAVAPHMHLLGKDMLMSVRFANGSTRDLIRIDDWDFNWQYTYYFQQPIELPRGSRVTLIAHYDNSAQNPRNPNSPPRQVTWGEATTDEMCIGFIGVTKKGQDLTHPGEKDDLRDIFKAQQDDYRKKRAEAKRRRQGATEK